MSKNNSIFAVFTAIILIITLCLISYLIGNKKGKSDAQITITDTVIFHPDTLLPVIDPVASSHKIDYSNPMQIPEYKIIKDTALKIIYLPRETLTYKGGNDTSGRWRAVISGVQPRLDTLQQYPVYKTHEVTHIVYKQNEYSRWSFGVAVGYGLNGTKWSPTVAVVLNYDLIRFKIRK